MGMGKTGREETIEKHIEQNKVREEGIESRREEMRESRDKKERKEDDTGVMR